MEKIKVKEINLKRNERGVEGHELLKK